MARSAAIDYRNRRPVEHFIGLRRSGGAEAALVSHPQEIVPRPRPDPALAIPLQDSEHLGDNFLLFRRATERSIAEGDCLQGVRASEAHDDSLMTGVVAHRVHREPILA